MDKQTGIDIKKDGVAFAGNSPRGGRNVADLFGRPLDGEATPSEDNHVLQVALLWGDTLIDVKHFEDGQVVRIGDGEENDFPVFAKGVGARYPLAVSGSRTIKVNVPPETGLSLVSKGDSFKSREQLKSEGKLKPAQGAAGDEVELGLHDQVTLTLDKVSFMIRFSRPSARVTAPRLEEQDFSFFKISTISILVFIAMVVSIFITPKVDDGGQEDIFQNPAKYVKLLVRPEKKIELKKELSGAKEGAKAKDDEGKFGKKEEKKQEADPSKKGAPVVDANKREEDRKKVMSAGLLGAMGGAAGAASNVFGPGGLGTGINNALGGLKGGAGMGDAGGVGGLGSRGGGAGGGGTGLGLGGLGTKGVGRGAGGGGIDLGGRGKEGTRIIPGKTTVVGGLAKDVIQKVIKRHENEIKYCYESELQKTPDLSGKVAVAWTIDGSGAVADANVSESTLGSNSVEACILTRIRRWKFPEPEGGGVVSVTFPWVFKPAGSGDE
ncbi:MAG: hypothetical protein RL653_1174 [Pseudomonadota bacterium]|jgi:TonB family protein